MSLNFSERIIQLSVFQNDFLDSLQMLNRDNNNYHNWVIFVAKKKSNSILIIFR